MRNNHRKNPRRQRGNAVIEFAIAMPMLLLLMFGAIDFARVYYHAVTLANAAGTGAFYGAQNNVTAGHYDGMSQRAREDSLDIPTMSASSSRFCDCPQGYEITGKKTVDCLTELCPGYGMPRAYARVQTSEAFTTVVPWPGVPDSLTVGRIATMRVQ